MSRPRGLMRSDSTRRGLAPIDVAAHRDFAEEDARRTADFLETSLRERPLRGVEVVTLVPGEEPTRETRAAWTGWAKANGLSSLGRRVERLTVPHGSVVVVLLGEEGVRVRTFDVSDLAAAEEAPAPSCAALMPAPPGARDAVPMHAPGQPWRRGRWVAPLPPAPPRRSK